jgi:acyl-coenzyme A synthetase/AMP-(fatty) acid ligase/SAM-dependent methyltransferase
MSRGIPKLPAIARLRQFACPACYGSLKPYGAGADEYGWLTCDACKLAYPVLGGFVHFGEALPAGETPDIAGLRALEREIAGDPQAYSRFVEQASRRPSYEPYAAFAPFNEATRALYPLIPALRRHLEPGGLIVDVWCRTGWTGALLAGLFPQQHVISLWEGSGGVLGYAGYRHWLGEEARPANWSIAFADPRRGLPFAAASVALLHAADSLHRFDLESLLGECLRVTSEEGALVFPHVHLANGEPDPFFDRGGTIRHGNAYRRWLEDRLKPGRRSGYVLSERALFDRVDSRPLTDESGTPDYNALIAILSDRHGPYEIARTRREYHGGDRLILNPLVAVDPVQGKAAYDPTAFAGRADYLLQRHPVYAERLAACLPTVLQESDLRLLYWARIAPELSLDELGARAGLAAPLLAETVRRLDAQETIHAAPVNAAGARLQRFYSTRQHALPLGEQQFATLWRDAHKRFGARPLLQTEDGSMFSIAEAEEILSRLVALLREKGVGAERPLVILSTGGAEAILAIWAAWLLGAPVAPLDPALPAALLGETIRRLKPALILADISLRQSLPAAASVLYLGAETTDPTATSLADELGNHDAVAIDTLTAPDESAIAAILFTSGSTGRPKGVLLSQGSLRRSAQTIADGLGWQEGDVLLSPGGLHTMSGLRNPCVAALAAGATVVLPDPRRLAHPGTLAEICRQWQVTVLAAVPALITTVAAAAKTAALRFAPLRQVAVTGSMLSRALQAEGEAAFGASIQVYYGLTETGGVCLLVPPGTAREDDGDVGTPAGALLRIVDEAGQYLMPGAVGELQIYSANLTPGYLDDPSRSTALFDRGWLRSGDMARWSSEGHAILCGRKDEQIKNRYGEIVQPAAIEALLCRRDDVAEAVVTGISDGANMKIFAFVVPKRDGGTQWLAALQAETLRTFGPQQTPDRFVEKVALPRLSSGKVARLALRE